MRLPFLHSDGASVPDQSMAGQNARYAGEHGIPRCERRAQSLTVTTAMVASKVEIAQGDLVRSPRARSGGRRLTHIRTRCYTGNHFPVATTGLPALEMEWPRRSYTRSKAT